jgi:hypothetical protein
MLRLIVGAISSLAIAGSATAADYSVAPRYGQSYLPEVADICHIERCGPRGCRIVNVCHCPDRFSCYGVYDAYGPYGGRRFLDAYTRY